MLSWKTNTKLQVNLYAFWTRIKGWDQQQFMHYKWKTKIAHKRVLKSTSSLGCCFHYSPLRKSQSRRLSCCTSWATQPLSPGLCILMSYFSPQIGRESKFLVSVSLMIARPPGSLILCFRIVLSIMKSLIHKCWLFLVPADEGGS